MLDGAPVSQELVLLAPGPGYDPLRATFSLIIAQSISDLGFNCRALPTDFNVLVNTVYIPDENGELTFDMYLLGWSLGAPSCPLTTSRSGGRPRHAHQRRQQRRRLPQR